MRSAFGTVLRSYRTTRGLTQEELADRSGLSVRAIRNLEIGRTERPQRQSVTLLATALHLDGPDHATLVAASGRGRTDPFGYATAPGLGRVVPSISGQPGRDALPQTPALDSPADPGLGGRVVTAAGEGRVGLCELPPDVPELVGRDGTVDGLIQVLTTPGPRLALVTGGPGVGRTATAVHVAHRVREWFPDGQVYADLDHPGGPVPAEAVLGRVLRSLGVTGLPAGGDERAALLRAGLAARRVLVVLDNVASEAQVRPLLTTGSASAVVVTSRRALVALPGAHAVRLDPLCPEFAWRLLSRLVGDRMHAGPARAVVDACAGLPLALQVCGVWLAARPHRPVADLAGLLADNDLVLDRLAVADLSVRASIDAHVAGLRADERRLLHQLGHLDGPFDPAVLRHRLAMAEPVLRDGLDGLAQANLLDAGYQLNSLVRTYAREDGGQPRLRAAQ